MANRAYPLYNIGDDGIFRGNKYTIVGVEYDYTARDYRYHCHFYDPNLLPIDLLEDDMYGVITKEDKIKNSKCECGAFYTSFKDKHLDWCPCYKVRK